MDEAYYEKENLPEIIKNKSKWAPFLVITSGFLVMTLSAITIGAIFGYTYCYIEHRCIKPGYHNHSSSIQIIHYRDSEDAKYKRTINGALMSNVLVSRILKVGHSLLNNTAELQAGQLGSNGTVVGANGTLPM